MISTMHSDEHSNSPPQQSIAGWVEQSISYLSLIWNSLMVIPLVLVLRGVYVLWSLNTACFVWEWEKSSKFKVHILKKIFSWDVKFVFGLSPAISSITVLQSTFPISHPASPFWSKPPKHASWLLDSVIWWALTKCDTNMFCPTQRNVGHSEWFL